MVRTELKRAFCSKAFLLACGIAFAMLAIGGWDYIIYKIYDLLRTSWLPIYLGFTCFWDDLFVRTILSNCSYDSLCPFLSEGEGQRLQTAALVKNLKEGIFKG